MSPTLQRRNAAGYFRHSTVESQAIAVGHLTDAIRNLEQVTQQTVSAVQQFEHAAQGLRTLSNELSDLPAS